MICLNLDMLRAISSVYRSLRSFQNIGVNKIHGEYSNHDVFIGLFSIIIHVLSCLK